MRANRSAARLAGVGGVGVAVGIDVEVGRRWRMAGLVDSLLEEAVAARRREVVAAAGTWAGAFEGEIAGGIAVGTWRLPGELRSLGGL